MKKILFTGQIDGLFGLIKKGLGDEFEIVECPFGNTMRRTIRSEKPCVIVCAKSKEMQPLIFKETREDFPEVGVVAICEQEDKSLDVFKDEGLVVLHRPVKSSEVRDAIRHAIASTEKMMKKRILTVDDNAMVLRNIKEILGEKYEVSFANSGKKALEVMQQKEFDLVLLDYEMPNMSGYQVFKEMKKDAKLSEVPVVFLTGVSDRNAVMEVVEIKPAGYLLKPINSKVLEEKLEEILG